MSKVFDILIKSGFNPEGAKAAEEELRKIGVTADKSGKQAQSMFDKLEQGGMKLMRAGQGFRQLGDLFGSETLSNLGNLVGGIGGLTNSLGEMATILQRIASIKLVGPLALIFAAGEGVGALATGVENKLGMADATQKAAALQRVSEIMKGMSPEENARKIGELSDSIKGMTSLEQTNAINAWADAMEKGVGDVGKPTALGALLNIGKDAIAQIDKGLQKLSADAQKRAFILPLISGSGEQLFSGLKSIEAQVTDFRTSAATERRTLLENIAIAEGRRLQDIARNNARQLQSIEQQRTDALAAAAETYASTIASIDQSTAENRERIEEDFQDRIRQIKEGSGQSIEDAIERRDARALAKALQSQAQQINQAERDHDKQLADNAKAAEQQKAQAAVALKAQQDAADAAARKAIDAMREADRVAAEDQQIAQKRSLQDFDLAKLREQQALLTKLHDQYVTMQTAFNQQQTLYRSHLNAITSITNEATRPQSALATAIVRFLQDALGNMLGELSSGPSVIHSR